MTHDAKALLEKALALPDSERAELAGNLIASLDTAVEPDADAACKEEVARRLQGVRSGKVTTISWQEVQRKAHTLLHGQKTGSISSRSRARVFGFTVLVPRS